MKANTSTCQVHASSPPTCNILDACTFHWAFSPPVGGRATTRSQWRHCGNLLLTDWLKLLI
ncbi:hypothetical protein V1477_014354 [Vespula maculifrons]|uniref:Uncharacterized protein n=1 Tax=Vespula maculifrons TaxID=7453 RepID=A0ABD2BKU2_VESMC